MFAYLTGSLIFISCTILSFYTGKANEDKDYIDENRITKNPNNVIQIPYSAEDITFSMLNNPNNPLFIGHLFKSEKNGAEYNL